MDGWTITKLEQYYKYSLLSLFGARKYINDPLSIKITFYSMSTVLFDYNVTNI